MGHGLSKAQAPLNVSFWAYTMENEHHFSYELREFVLDRVLNEGGSRQILVPLKSILWDLDSQTHSIALLGSLPHKDSDERKPAIVRVERLGISSSFASTFPVQVDDVRPIENTDIVRLLIDHLTVIVMSWLMPD